MSRQLALRLSPVVAFYQVEMAEAGGLLSAWRHPLHLPDDDYPTGRPYTRPFGSLAFMEDRGRRAATVVLASTINASVSKQHGWHRYNTVDLARIARSPDRRDQQCLRAVLRIARDYLARLWLGTYPGHRTQVFDMPASAGSQTNGGPDMPDITSNPGSADRGLHVAVQPLHDSDLTIDNGYLLRTGSRRSSGEPAILYASEDSTLNVHSARELCGVLLYLHLEHASGATTADECDTVAAPLAQPEEFTPERSVWPVAPGVDVVHSPPFLGWIAATEPIIVDIPTTRWRLIEALAALTAALGRDHQVAHEAIRASRTTSVDIHATTQAAAPTQVGRGVRVLYSDDEPESVTGTPTEQELDAVLGVVQILTEQPDAGWTTPVILEAVGSGKDLRHGSGGEVPG